MSGLFKNIVKLPPPHTARSYSELTPVYTADEVAKTVSSFEVELAKANEDYKTLFSAFESCQDELKESNERESVLSCQLDSHMERVAELEKENKRESMELRSRLGSALRRTSEYNSAIENMQQKLAKANERARELELHANSIADALGFNAENNNRFATSVICTNIRNLHSFSDCLSRIENAFLMVESETDEFGETSEDVAFSKWGLTPHEYCIEFGKWLNKFALEQKVEAFENAQIPRHAKAGCIGEFNFVIEYGRVCPECWQDKDDSCHMCNGESDENGLSDLTATVPWDLCKDIWLRMNKIYAEQLRKGDE